jgi:hypothetical protein
MPRPTDPRTHITYQRQYRRCGSTRCKCYQADHPGHGPYWFGYYRALIAGKRRLRTWYIGKRLPQDASA